MKHRILKKIRNFRVLSGLLITLLTMVSFQNCAPPKAACSSGSADCAQEDSKTSASTSGGSGSKDIWSTRPGGNGTAGGSGGGSSGSLGGSNGGGGGGINIGGGTGGGDGTGGTGGTGDTGGGGSTDTTFRIITQPTDTNVMETATFELKVQISGGKGPYKFRWSKDGVAISDAFAAFETYSDDADSYYKQGTYSVTVTDASGQSITSQNARVVFVEPQVGCPKASYFTYTNAAFDNGINYFTEYFDGPRGKLLLHQSYDLYNVLYPNAGTVKLSTYNTTAALAYKEKTWISCRTAIPRIHTPAKNPGYNNTYGHDQYANGNNYTYEGSVEFECRNKKLLYKANSCKWKYTAPPVQRGGSDR